MAKTEVAAQQASTALAIMSDLEQDAGAGFDGMTQEDYALPFLRLLTSTSPEVGEIDGALPGMMLNSVTGELFDGKKGIAVVPCAYVRQYIEWAPRGQGSGAPVHIYPATSDILSQTHKEAGDNKDYLDNGNYIENTANYYVMVISDAGVPEPVDHHEVHAAQEEPQVEFHDAVCQGAGQERPVHAAHVQPDLQAVHRGRVQRQGQVVRLGSRAYWRSGVCGYLQCCQSICTVSRFG
jgi:hypothetical protein